MSERIHHLMDAISLILGGMWLSNLVWHFRMQNKLLREELILGLERGGTPFLDWWVGLSLFMIILFSIFLLRLVYRSKQKNKYART